MMTKAQKYFNSIKDKRVAFIGVGVSHTDLIKVFLSKGINCVICDKRDESEFDALLIEDFRAKGCEFALGENYLDEIFNCDIVFRTPGMYYNDPTLTKARKQGIVITSEMETFFDLCPCKTYALTGSDGKTTTTTLVSEFLKAEGKRVHLGGNIGKALLPLVETISETDVAVCELSSFQLISMRESPDVAGITNIRPNHLNVHGTMEEYTQAKCNILYHQNAYSKAILSLDDEVTHGLADLVRGELAWFSIKEKPDNGAFLREDGMLCYNECGKVTEYVHMNDIKIPGMHNVEDYLTAIAMTYGEVKPETVAKIAKEFGGVEHRIEFVRELDGVKYYNNSIASSPTRVLACLAAFDKKQIMIQGGSDKGVSFEPMAAPICEKVKVLILMGQTKDKIRAAVEAAPNFKTSGIKIITVKDMAEAVLTAREYAEEGDIVSLTPACASFDMYRMFEDRGRHFKQLVNELS
ncbi:UDP-N-acetylmuramoyl-L-alanine--D-glutamate ligase [Ruminococcus albus]|uniref:UDP-N-acetylmuramoylalanine--D-glutamate ligase n=1 Tax=Ruminococcus albus 8 TaxID=246199 RepID=E9SAS3_RUMAL|nr:UDP-N-acetylmuramoyl-L-alanine--D-glutamate ligase [Ruminococcus albus]EGC03737.1 UDP-N-acetylmuramoyl-L-alanine--D-glutamate ligase [Ruminococcus albus 8]